MTALVGIGWRLSWARFYHTDLKVSHRREIFVQDAVMFALNIVIQIVFQRILPPRSC